LLQLESFGERAASIPGNKLDWASIPEKRRLF
jgi:hypothetical protein